MRSLFDSEDTDGYPRWFANGRRIAFHRIDAERRSRIAVGEYHAGTGLADVVFVSGGPFDIEPAPSPDGRLLAFPMAGESGQDIAYLHLATGERTSCAMRFAENFPSWHPRRPSILFHRKTGSATHLQARSLGSKRDEPLTKDGSPNIAGNFSADGARVAFSSERDGDREIYILDVVSGAETRVTERTGRDGYPKFSPDGRRLAFHAKDGSGSTSLRMLDLENATLRQVTCP